MCALRAATILPAAIASVGLFGCATNQSHWVDTTGQSRSDSDLQQTMASCAQQASAVQTQQQAQMQQGAGGMANEKQLGFLVAASSLISAINYRSQVQLCLAQAGWAQSSTPASVLAPPDVPTSVVLPVEPPQSKSPHVTPQWGQLVRSHVVAIPPKEWRETPENKVPDTLSFISNRVLAMGDGTIHANAMMNYDSINKTPGIGDVQSVLFSVTFRCDTYQASALLIEFYSEPNANGDLLKQARNHPITIKPYSVADQMRRYVCAETKRA